SNTHPWTITPPAPPRRGPRDAGAGSTMVAASFGAFGAIALSGDTLAIGAPGEMSHATGIDGDQSDTSAPNAGAVYVFTRTAGSWAQRAYVKASNTANNSHFGSRVVTSGDTLAVVASGESDDNSAPDIGAVYLFA